MAFNSQGVWQQEDAGVANRIASITAGSGSYMRQARASGQRTANRRGLGNSSMSAGASEASAIAAAAPIAAQEAQQIHGHNMAQHEGGIRTDQLGMQLAAAEREMLARAITDMSGQRYNALATTLQNHEIPSAVRSATQRSINDQYQSALNYLQRLYGVRLSDAGFGGATTPVPGINISGLGGVGAVAA